MKRQISFVAALIMLITTVFSNTVFAAFTDVAEDSRYRNAIITLSKLDVINGYDDGTFKPEGQITRAEFTKMLIAALGYGDNATEPTEFDDVTDHWARTYIKTAYDMKIINGTGERTFEPDKPVTYEQALKMIVCTLGYEAKATLKGGYPTGYLTVANDLSLGANITGQGDSEPATRQVIAQAVYNALEVEIQEKNQLGVWEGSDKTILEDYLKVKKIVGTLVGVEDTKTNDFTGNLIRNQIAVSPSSAAYGTETIVINMGDYKDHTIGELAKLVGNKLTMYYSQGDDASDRELKILDYETTTNDVKTIDYKKFAGYSDRTFKYNDGPSRKSLRVKDNVTVIYNGQAVSDPTSVVIKDRLDDTDVTGKRPANMEELLGMWLGTNDSYNIRGDVTFTDTGADGTVDIISINDYKTMVALKAPTTSDYRIQNLLKTGENIVLNPNDVSKKIYIEKDGKEIEVTAIRANDVISYTESLDETIINVYVVNKTVKGTVNSMNTTDGTITIANDEYDLGEKCVEYIKNKEGKDLATGVSGTFYLDKLGAVVYGKLDTVVADPYAYITGVTEDAGEDVVYVSMYMPGSKGVSSYKLSDKAEVNGTKVNTITGLKDILEPIAATCNIDTAGKNIYDGNVGAEHAELAQPVRVKLNSAKDTILDIYTIDTSAKEKQNDDSTKLALYKDLSDYYYTGSSFKTKSSSSTQFTVNSSTTVLYVPRDRSNKTGYSKKTVANAFKSGNKYWVQAYDVNKSNVASLVILYGDNAQLNNITDTTLFSIVAKTPDESYDDATGSTTKSITVYEGTTSTKSWLVKANNSEFDNVQPGDVIQFAYDDENKIQGLRSIFKYADIAAILKGKTTTVKYIEKVKGSGEEEATGSGGGETQGVTQDVTVTRVEKYNWNEETSAQTEANFYQKYVFDYRHPKSSVTDPNPDNYFVTYPSSSLGVVPKSRACVYNVYQLIENDAGTINKLYLTKEGFENGELRSSDVLDYDEVNITTSTKFLRMEDTGSDIVFSPYAAGTETNLSATDLEAARDFGEECSKAMVFTQSGNARLIVLLPR